MESKEQDARARMIKAATDILGEGADVETITVRQIAKRAGVGVGTVNYHFTSKDNLLGVAVGQIMAEKINDFLKPETNPGMAPADRLKTMLKEVCRVAAANKKLARFMLAQILANGNFAPALYLMPFLKELYQGSKDELELRVIALQIIQPIQFAGMSPEAFLMYSGVDFYNETARGRMIDSLVDHLLDAKGED